MNVSTNKLLIVYSGVLTAAVAVALLSSPVRTAPRATVFDEIDVRRINVREDDGTLRYVLTNTTHAPQWITHGKEYPHPGSPREAGMYFFNNEGTENGGMTWGGRKQDGKVGSFGHLSFDQYDQDEVLTLSQSESDGRRNAGLTISDRPSEPLDMEDINRLTHMPAGPARDAAMKQAKESGKYGLDRVFVGKTGNRESVVALEDAKARPRMLLRVKPEGTATIEFLDEQGKVVRSIGPDDVDAKSAPHDKSPNGAGSQDKPTSKGK
jgi:hypothetical protein